MLLIDLFHYIAFIAVF